jgi:hypothetical protein
MKTFGYLLAMSVFMLAGCNYGSMSQYSYDAEKGKYTTKLYSKYYDAGVWLIPKHLGMSVVVDHEKTEVPILHGVQASLGALTPSDLSANGKVTIYIWNMDTAPHNVKIVRVTSRSESFSVGDKVINAIPKNRSGGAVGNIGISNYGTDIPIKVEYELNGKRGTAELKLLRRTFDELKLYFGPRGKPPYPWYQGS